MSDKERVIADFESNYWEIDVVIKERLLSLSFEDILMKLVEWQNWSDIQGKLVIGGQYD